MLQIKHRLGAVALALATALGLGLSLAAPASADVPGYPTIKRYETFDVQIVNTGVPSQFNLAAYVDQWKFQASVIGPHYRTGTVGDCGSRGGCAYIKWENRGANGVRVSATYSDSGSYTTQAVITINSAYSYKTNELRTAACNAVGKVFLNYAGNGRPASTPGSCVIRDPYPSNSAYTGNAADIEYWRTGANSSS
jgi:hypothetical protein